MPTRQPHQCLHPRGWLRSWVPSGYVATSQYYMLVWSTLDSSRHQMVPQASWLTAHYPEWHTCTILPWVENTVFMGYQLQFQAKPTCFMLFWTNLQKCTGKKYSLLWAEECKSIVAPFEPNKGWYSCYFIVLKRGWALSPTLGCGIGLPQPISQTLIFTVAYPDHRTFLRLAFKCTAYEYLVLPFSPPLVPCTFTKCIKAVLAPFQERGIYILASLDDWALIASSREQA